MSARGHSHTETLCGFAIAADGVLRSPASGLPCVHWRLRIVEGVSPTLEFVHEVNAPTPFMIEVDRGGRAVHVRIGGDVRMRGGCTLHRAGSPGARAVAQAFDLAGQVQVQEFLVRLGERVDAEGYVIEPERNAGPYRDIATPVEVVEASLRLPGRLRLTSLLSVLT